MNTFWLKMAGIAVLAVVVVVAIGYLATNKEPKQPTKTIYDQWEEDEKKLNAPPQYQEPPAQPAEGGPNIPTTAVQPTEPVEPPTPLFEKLRPEEEIEADRLWQWVVSQRKMGRLPVMTYKQMVDTCREIIRRWPQSEYAFKARRALADLPEQYRKMYNITDEEINLGNYK